MTPRASQWHTSMVKGRPDLGQYDLNGHCAHPECGLASEELHHIHRKGMGGGSRSAAWVELPDGQVLPNWVGLCRQHHRLVTDNEAAIYWDSDLEEPYYLWLRRHRDSGLDARRESWEAIGPLSPHPPLEAA